MKGKAPEGKLLEQLSVKILDGNFLWCFSNDGSDNNGGEWWLSTLDGRRGIWKFGVAETNLGIFPRVFFVIRIGTLFGLLVGIGLLSYGFLGGSEIGAWVAMG